MVFDKYGYTKCTECDGTGGIYNGSTLFVCETCWGSGFLDWVEVVVGKSCGSTIVYDRKFLHKKILKEILKVEGKI
ncbi:MAG: hypothetical protein PVG65_03410 [Candidatus Thorarchaeota archaeon]|jgi:hypothetical protein